MADTVRLARLRGAKKATELLGTFEVRQKISSNSGQVDVLGILSYLDIVVLFRPLNSLLGAYLRGDQPGVLLTTERSPSIQRFTAAHELGHAVLEHEPSLDSLDTLRRAALGRVEAIYGSRKAQLQEIEADSFASEFLLPKWLMVWHARAQGWSANDLNNPEHIYQLSLRCGASYEATIRALARNQIITTASQNAALRVQPKKLKGAIKLDSAWTSPWADTWSLGPQDQDRSLPLVVGDLMGVTLEQRAGAGYLVAPSEDLPSQIELLEDWNSIPAGEVGGISNRTFIYKAVGSGPTTLEFFERRPWEADALKTTTFAIELRDREGGLSQATRSSLPEWKL